jgi:hypothetical protein
LCLAKVPSWYDEEHGASLTRESRLNRIHFYLADLAKIVMLARKSVVPLPRQFISSHRSSIS